MVESELRKKYLAWWQPLNPKGRLFRNNSGSTETAHGGWIKFGIPQGGGGSDLMGWNNNGVFMAREIKTITDTLKKKQADFLTLVKNCGGDAGLILENSYSKSGFDEIAWNENSRNLIR